MKNFFNEAFKFICRCLLPCVVPIQYVILYMMQSGEYIISADMIQSYRKIDLEEANILLKIAYFPQQTTIDMVNKLIFDPRSYSPKVNINIRFIINCTMII